MEAAPRNMKIYPEVSDLLCQVEDDIAVVSFGVTMATSYTQGALCAMEKMKISRIKSSLASLSLLLFFPSVFEGQPFSLKSSVSLYPHSYAFILFPSVHNHTNKIRLIQFANYKSASFMHPAGLFWTLIRTRTWQKQRRQQINKRLEHCSDIHPASLNKVQIENRPLKKYLEVLHILSYTLRNPFPFLLRSLSLLTCNLKTNGKSGSDGRKPNNRRVREKRSRTRE